MFMDTKQEKKIDLGPKWPFDPLNKGECLASSVFGVKYNVDKNKLLYFHFSLN